MTADDSPRGTRSRRAAAIVICYPPSWRARYESEYLALLIDIGLKPATVLNAIWGAILAWFRPTQGLDQRERLRSTVSVVWSAWVVLVGGMLVFAQLTEDAPFRTADGANTLLADLYGVCVVAGGLSVLALAVGAAPLIVHVVRAAIRRKDTASLALLVVPFVAPLVLLGILIAVARLSRHAGSTTSGVSLSWGVLLVLVGLATTLASAWAPGCALRHSDVPDRALKIGTISALPMTVAIILSWLASVGYAVALRADAPHLDATVARPLPLAVFSIAMVLAAAVAVVSLTRGLRVLSTGTGETT